MNIAVLADDISYHELSYANENINWFRLDALGEVNSNQDFDCIFCLNDEAGKADYSAINIPVFVNSVSQTLLASNHGLHVVRINGWKGFLERNTWEISGQLSTQHIEILEKLDKKIMNLPDEPGFVSARIISMIVNEAYFAKEEDVSTEEEINTAMKLGTNYPKGPFEWKNKIGINNIYELLKALSFTDSKYKPSLLLQKEALKI